MTGVPTDQVRLSRDEGYLLPGPRAVLGRLDCVGSGLVQGCASADPVHASRPRAGTVSRTSARHPTQCTPADPVRVSRPRAGTVSGARGRRR